MSEGSAVEQEPILFDEEGRHFYTRKDTAARLDATVELVKRLVALGVLRERPAAGLLGHPKGRGRPHVTVMFGEDVDAAQRELLTRMRVPQVEEGHALDRGLVDAWSRISELEGMVRDVQAQLAAMERKYRLAAASRDALAAEVRALNEEVPAVDEGDG